MKGKGIADIADIARHPAPAQQNRLVWGPQNRAGPGSPWTYCKARKRREGVAGIAKDGRDWKPLPLMTLMKLIFAEGSNPKKPAADWRGWTRIEEARQMR